MARGNNQKLKLMYIAKIFMEETDENNGITTPELIEKLKLYGIAAERKSIYTDIEELQNFGMDIYSEKEGKYLKHHLGSRQFELAELKLLVDSIQSAKFITEKKSNELIKKLESLISKNEAKQLQRQVYISGRVKTMNESIYYNVDKLHTAIGRNSQITFQYFQWNTKKEMELRRDGKRYEISPWGLIWEDEYYYLIGYETESDKIKHFRVDKMLKINIVEKEREGKDKFEAFGIPDYSKKYFGMYDGKEEHVGIELKNHLVGVMIDRFGKDIMLLKTDDEHVKTYVDVAVSTQFLGWVIGLGADVKIISPQNVVDQMKETLSKINELYE